MKILFIGDIVGNPGREIVSRILPELKEEFHLDGVIANAENVAGGSGVTPKIAESLFQAGIDVLTTGDHIWKRKEVFEIIDREPRLLRPLNLPPGSPGQGSGIFMTKSGTSIAVINLLGRVFMEAVDCPFRTVIGEIEQLAKKTKIIMVDIHAEATSEKIALGWYLDGLVSAVVGTHTHIQTADERILPRGTAYITDVGMCGPFDSVIGRRVQDVISRFVTQIPTRFEVAAENLQLHGVVLEIEENTGKAKGITRIQKKVNGI
jgi:metallophosphoesterase (TIGR00282 family)